MSKSKKTNSSYGSIRKVKSIVNNMERQLSIVLRKYLEFGESSERLSRDIEWFISWFLKLKESQPVFWCDELRNLRIKKISKTEIAIKATAGVGVEDGSGKTADCEIRGLLTLKNSMKELKSCNIEIRNDYLDLKILKAKRTRSLIFKPSP
jgi:hypothetical protein